MLACRCRCERPRVFADDDGRCHRCGHDQAPVRVTASTWRIAIAIAEVALGYRRIGDTHGQTGGRRTQIPE